MSSPMAEERLIRLFSLFCTALTTPLLIASTVESLVSRSYWDNRQVSGFCFGYIPLALSFVASAASLRHHRRHRIAGTPVPARPRMAILDFVAMIFYISVLIPIWAVDVGKLREPGLGLLAGYTTAPMIVNMFIHLGFFVYNFKWLSASFTDQTCRQCPNCRNKFAISGPEVRTAAKGGEGYSLLRAEEYLDGDDDALAYTDARTTTDLLPQETETAKVKEMEV